MEIKKPVAVVVGAGPGNGAALARRFAEAGYAIAVLARRRSTLSPIESELAGTRGFECDVGDPNGAQALAGRRAFVDPAGVAEIAFQLCRQQRRAWSFEVEARPYAEKW